MEIKEMSTVPQPTNNILGNHGKHLETLYYLSQEFELHKIDVAVT